MVGSSNNFTSDTAQASTYNEDQVIVAVNKKRIDNDLPQLIVNEKLAKNPWLTAEKLKSTENEENDRRFRTETMKFLFDTKRIQNPLDLLTEM